MGRHRVSHLLGTPAVCQEPQPLVFKLNLESALLLSKCLYKYKGFWMSPNILISLASALLASFLLPPKNILKKIPHSLDRIHVAQQGWAYMIEP